MANLAELLHRDGYQTIIANTESTKLIQPQLAEAELGKAEAPRLGLIIGPITQFTGFFITASQMMPPGQPSYGAFIVDLSHLALGVPWVVSGNVTEVAADGFTPHIGAADFRSDGAVLDQSLRAAVVWFRMYWDWALPVGAMITVGHGVGTL